jgi:hypothetical protein
VSRERRTAKLEEEHARRNPPKLVRPVRVVQDGERVERLDGSSDPVPPGAFLVVREIVNPPPAEDELDPPSGGGSQTPRLPSASRQFRRQRYSIA